MEYNISARVFRSDNGYTYVFTFWGDPTEYTNTRAYKTEAMCTKAMLARIEDELTKRRSLLKRTVK